LGYCIAASIARQRLIIDVEILLSSSKELKMLKKSVLFAGMIALGLGGSAIAAAAPTPKISKARAEAMALKLAPGKITDAEYEYEGHGWRWSFDIQQKGHIQEIGIDGATGKVVENKSEGKVDHD
jgi:uncharacterized membrane protein YkoI